MQRVTHLVGRAIRETGQAMDRLGLTIAGNEIFRDHLSRHRTVQSLFDKKPLIDSGAFVAQSASVIGNVTLDSGSSVWYGAVLRGDTNSISVGKNSNVQDRAVVGTVPSSSVKIGSNVTVGHGALLISCTIGDDVLVGQGAIVQEGSSVASKCIVAAGAVLPPNTQVPSGQLWAGNPAKFIRNVTPEEATSFAKSASSYAALATQHKTN